MTLAAGCAADAGDVLAPATTPGEADGGAAGSCPSIPIGVVRDEVPPFICAPAEPLPVQVMKEVDAFWGSQVELCQCGPDVECAGDAVASVEHGWIDYDPALVSQLSGGDLTGVHWLLAHEMGHEIQGHLTGRPGDAEDAELEADCLAGVYLGSHVCQGRITEADLEALLGAACASGQLGWLDPATHGSCADRVAEVRRGVEGYLAGASAADTCGR